MPSEIETSQANLKEMKADQEWMLTNVDSF
jgi:hypothetical protein